MRAPRGGAAELAEPPPEADRVEGAPHPRDTLRLFGQERPEAGFLAAFATGRLHHGWMLTGPRGVGKATLAWRIARFLLATPEAGDGLFGAPPPPASLDIPADHPVARRMHALSDSRLFLLRRSWDEDKSRLRAVIGVEDVRRLKAFFNLSAADGGRRVAIIDAADEMNPNAANALLKLLEESPAGATLLMVAHQPSSLLPTIRSRVRALRLGTLGAEDMAAALAQAGIETDAAAALAELSGGSVGEAIRLVNLDGLQAYAQMVDLFAGMPRLDRIRALHLADSAGGRAAEGRFDVLLTLFELFLARLARAGIAGPPRVEAAPGEARLFARLAPSPAAGRLWAQRQQDLGARARHGRAVNLDPAALLMDMVLQVNETAARLAA